MATSVLTAVSTDVANWSQGHGISELLVGQLEFRIPLRGTGFHQRQRESEGRPVLREAVPNPRGFGWKPDTDINLRHVM